MRVMTSKTKSSKESAMQAMSDLAERTGGRLHPDGLSVYIDRGQYAGCNSYTAGYYRSKRKRQRPANDPNPYNYIYFES